MPDSAAIAALTAPLNLYQSPALAANQLNGATEAYEVKCLIHRSVAEQLERSLGSQMLLDPFAAKESTGHYQITTISTDTSNWDCFYRTPGYSKRKYRLRRYGAEAKLYLEQKTRRGHRVSKRRVETTESELSAVFASGNKKAAGSSAMLQRLAASDEETLWDLHMFHHRIDSLSLHPVCMMTYERRAWFADTESGPVRWTLDRNLAGVASSHWSMVAAESLRPILQADQVICEFKFSGAMPQLFKSIVFDHQMTLGGFSKYRNSLAILTGKELPSLMNRATMAETDASLNVAALGRGLSHD